ncbi:copper chaperone PCu(A)C [Actinoplanes sp. NPDC026619]|uniref:copper chaperone PCu(A)C n=1 Tax=Actinoplanes sp. NPDC026619 TaxID=3155798 RepID=UPI0033DE10CB
MRRFALTALAAAALTLSLSACGGSEEKAEAAAPPAAELTVKDPWVKAVDSGMTAAFGTLVNNTAADVTVVSAASPASPMELHEMAMQDGAMVMRPKEGGFVIKAGGTHELSPGGDHLMLMQPSAPIKPGDELRFTLTLGDGGTVSFSAVAKPFAGAGESYAPSTMPSMAS